MIVRPRPRLLELFVIWRLSILPTIAPQILALTAYSAGVVWAVRRYPALFHNFSAAPFTLLGIALSIFLGFRNNACYDRWWEARRQLGALIGDCRSLARLLVTLPAADPFRRQRSVRRIIGYVYALMAHLRGQPMPADAQRYTPDWDQVSSSRNVPDALLRNLSSELAAMLHAGEFGELIYQSLDARVTALASIQVACERIRGTPSPFTYTLLLHRTAYAFCFLLPFGLAGTFGYATPVFCAVVAYAFFGLDELANELEEPFGEWLNALPLTAMARTVEISLLEALAEPALPPAAQPVGAVLR